MAWCEACDREVEGEVCPLCGGPVLQEIIPEDLDPADPKWALDDGRAAIRNWPVGPDGAPEAEALLLTAPDFESYAGLLLSRLAAAEIPALSRCSQRGEVGRLFGGFSTAGVDILVPESRLREAKNLLSSAGDAGET